MELVTVDIGGTHARFTIATIGDDGAITLGEPATLKTNEHASFETAWEHFAEISGRPLPRALALAVAGPVGGELIRFTNNPWVILPDQLPERLGVDKVTIVNDFGAVGHAVARASKEHFQHLTGPDTPLPASGTITIVGPGTGLGVAHVWRDGNGFYHVQATEGGHLDFAPLDAVEDAILARLRQRHRRVSVERVVAGPAIVDIYETLAALEQRPVLHTDDRTIWTRGTAGEDTLMAAAIDRFCLSLGSAAGDLALAQGGSAVVIAGGLGLRIKDTILSSGFAERFRAKGRFESLMASLPVKLITHPQPGLLGAAAAFQKEHA
ncbi:glucokinase [Novosphingobium sediminicola]|uniref:Glucokinase n=1 Tax=Novosphingobium sediminicola TaxID=563162 RepID=A0A7W6CJ69_9SPHN|nr:glucokinase [Novosphingobium sediminicola]MBB3955433.1 glucokinase [Novosphingobium sediminicola]